MQKHITHPDGEIVRRGEISNQLMSPVGQCVCVTFVEGWALGRLASLSARTQTHINIPHQERPSHPLSPEMAFMAVRWRLKTCVSPLLCVWLSKACHASAKEADKDASAGSFPLSPNVPYRDSVRRFNILICLSYSAFNAKAVICVLAARLCAMWLNVKTVVWPLGASPSELINGH